MEPVKTAFLCLLKEITKREHRKKPTKVVEDIADHLGKVERTERTEAYIKLAFGKIPRSGNPVCYTIYVTWRLWR